MTDQRSALLGEESHEELLAGSTSTCRSSLTKVAIRGKEVLPDKELQGSSPISSKEASADAGIFCLNCIESIYFKRIGTCNLKGEAALHCSYGHT